MVEGLGEKGVVIDKYRLVVTKVIVKVICTLQIGNVISNVVITMYSSRSVLEILGGHFAKYMIV